MKPHDTNTQTQYHYSITSILTRSSHLLDVWKSLIFIFLAISLGLSLMIDVDTATVQLLIARNHLEMISKFIDVTSSSFWRFELFPYVFMASKILSLFLIQIGKVFIEMA